jgi:hydroxymethylpyrimidine pyrophosphatase-like HAD family hydrolase
MEYKIIASDLDGTLLTLDQTVSEENHQAIEALQ